MGKNERSIEAKYTRIPIRMAGGGCSTCEAQFFTIACATSIGFSPDKNCMTTAATQHLMASDSRCARVLTTKLTPVLHWWLWKPTVRTTSSLYGDAAAPPVTCVCIVRSISSAKPCNVHSNKKENVGGCEITQALADIDTACAHICYRWLLESHTLQIQHGSHTLNPDCSFLCAMQCLRLTNTNAAKSDIAKRACTVRNQLRAESSWRSTSHSAETPLVAML